MVVVLGALRQVDGSGPRRGGGDGDGGRDGEDGVGVPVVFFVFLLLVLLSHEELVLGVGVWGVCGVCGVCVGVCRCVCRGEYREV